MGYSLKYPECQAHDVQLHHIYPQKWCKTNNYGGLRELLNADPDKDWINSYANLMPLSRETNLEWRDKHPKQFLDERSITYASVKKYLSESFIDEDGFKMLAEGPEMIKHFWEKRAHLMAAGLIEMTNVKV